MSSILRYSACLALCILHCEMFCLSCLPGISFLQLLLLLHVHPFFSNRNHLSGAHFEEIRLQSDIFFQFSSYVSSFGKKIFSGEDAERKRVDVEKPVTRSSASLWRRRALMDLQALNFGDRQPSHHFAATLSTSSFEVRIFAWDEDNSNAKNKLLTNQQNRRFHSVTVILSSQRSPLQDQLPAVSYAIWLGLAALLC